MNLYDVIIEKNPPTKRPTQNSAVVKLMAEGSSMFISIPDMLSGVKDYDGKNYFSTEQDVDSKGSASFSMFSAKE